MDVESASPVGDGQVRPSTGSKARRQDAVGGERETDARLWCHLYLNPVMLQPGFDLSKKIIGRGGCNTRSIFETTGAKIRLRGSGSGHLEWVGQRYRREAPVPLMLAITGEAGLPDKFCEALQMALDLLHKVGRRFEDFWCQQMGAHLPVTLSAGPLFWVGSLSEGSSRCVAPMLEAAAADASRARGDEVVVGAAHSPQQRRGGGH